VASYLVYIPGVTGASTDHLSRVGLGGLLDPNSSPDCVDATRFTPDGGQGVIFYWIDHGNPLNNPRHMGPHQDIDWTPAKPKGELPAKRFWLGVCHGQQVTPNALLRAGNIGGDLLTLDDGQQWLIPVAKMLPRKFDLDETGAPILVVKTKYQEFYEQAERNYRVLMRQSVDEDISMPEMWAFAERILNYNYRVTAEVIAWLGLLGEVSIINLLGGSFERGVIEQIEAQKKTA
jgi:hypothetical protein